MSNIKSLFFKPFSLVCYLFVLHLSVTAVQGNEAILAKRPNIVFILTDDQRYDEIAAIGNFPWLKTPNLDRLVNNGVTFENAFVTTSLCGPSRASFLTGTYASRHGVIVNEHVDYDKSLPTFPVLLQEAGYNTGFMGKWHQAMHNNPRPGFDYWACFWGQGKYFGDTFLLHDGATRVVPKGKYLTDELNDMAVEFIHQERGDQPFLLYLSHKALHQPFTPAPRHRKLYSNIDIPSQDDLDDDLAAKPSYISEAALKRRRITGGKAPLHSRIPDKMRTITAVDDGVGMIIQALEDNGQLDNTIIIFAGDNGYFMSEHGGLHDKRKAYDPSIRIPLIMWNPSIKNALKVDQLVLNIDLAPSLLDIVGAPIPEHMHGESWVPLLQADGKGREGFLYEYYKESDYRPRGGFPGTPTLHAYRTEDWKLVRYPDGDYKSELYHVSADPKELYNHAQNPEYAEKLVELNAKLDAHLVSIEYVAPEKIPGGGITHYQLYGN
jgi:arylsulfatase A-like enzyme